MGKDALKGISYEELLFKNWVLLDEKKILWDHDFRDLSFVS